MVGNGMNVEELRYTKDSGASRPVSEPRESPCICARQVGKYCKGGGTPPLPKGNDYLRQPSHPIPQTPEPTDRQSGALMHGEVLVSHFHALFMLAEYHQSRRQDLRLASSEPDHMMRQRRDARQMIDGKPKHPPQPAAADVWGSPLKHGWAAS